MLACFVRLEFLLRSRDLFLDSRNRTVTQFRRLFEVIFPLRLGEFRSGKIETLPHQAQFGNGIFFRIPCRSQGFGFFLLLGKFFLDDLPAFPACLVLFLLQCGKLDFKTHRLSFEFINLGRAGVDFGTEFRGGFVDQVDRLVRQKTLRDIFIGKRRQSRRL